MTRLSNEVIHLCRKKLLQLKVDLIHRSHRLRIEFSENDKNQGDEIDQTNSQIRENQILATQDTLRRTLLEIERALAKISAGTYGICEETQEVIEIDRLLAVPYTRYSIEGAEYQEAVNKKFISSS